jgi:hypothetical protein
MNEQSVCVRKKRFAMTSQEECHITQFTFESHDAHVQLLGILMHNTKISKGILFKVFPAFFHSSVTSCLHLINLLIFLISLHVLKY